MKEPISFADFSAHEVLAAKIRVNRSTNQQISAALKPHGVTINEWLMLGIISKSSGKVLLNKIAEELDVSAPFITKLAQSMIKRGFITDIRDSADRRRHHIGLTPAGLTLLTESEQSVRTALRDWLLQIPRENIAIYIETVLLVGKL